MSGELCGIAGVFFKEGGPVIESLLEMLKNLQHRGADSSGIGFYRQLALEPEEFLFVLDTLDLPGTAEKVTSSIAEIGGDIRDIRQRLSGGHGLDDYILSLDRTKFAELKRAISKTGRARVLSFGKRMTIMKEVGTVDALEKRYRGTLGKRDKELTATHGIGNVRFSTESAVDNCSAHPFQGGFEDVAVVHNGQITNCYKMKESLRMKGHAFETDNDTEVIVHYIVQKMMEGFSFKEALEQSVEDLDGPFAYMISTINAIGMAKDRLGLRPLVVAEGNGAFAAASEEAALMVVFENPVVRNIAPGGVEVLSYE